MTILVFVAIIFVVLGDIPDISIKWAAYQPLPGVEFSVIPSRESVELFLAYSVYGLLVDTRSGLSGTVKSLKPILTRKFISSPVSKYVKDSRTSGLLLDRLVIDDVGEGFATVGCVDGSERFASIELAIFGEVEEWENMIGESFQTSSILTKLSEWHMKFVRN